eukprot:gb/GECG01005384.1/.p1 GENE.gb/GECG01005384.1/~~gb/GECG01005384.1/.p1  ORF type:complete len:420 (+),score=34.60 gb/GECG01005384.1/:1-1260(+)
MSTSSSKKRVHYFYQGDVGHYYYGPGHPMKPQRMKMAHHLLLGYGLYRSLHVHRPHLATPEEMTLFHSDEYIDFLKRISPESALDLAQNMSKFQMGEYTDCPVFDGLFDFCRVSSGASIDSAVLINHDQADVCVNWAGGLHHAKKSEASGFCYVNDIVLAILELLKYHPRVLYIDIDIHHGDGVEEAFYCTDRVMTCSFHKFGDFFPGTGDVRDVGHGPGKNYSVNFPLRQGITDEKFESIFRPIISRIIESYRPTAIVLQCGADSLTGDRLGCFNLTLRGHAKCVEYVKSFGLPVIVLGGGGYTIRNVARCWAYETAVLLDQELPDAIPPNDYAEFYRPDYKLHLTPAQMEDFNTTDYLERHKAEILENLKQIEHAPSVPFQSVPPDSSNVAGRDTDERVPDDERALSKKLVVHAICP